MQSEQRYRLAAKSQYPGEVPDFTTPFPNAALDDERLSDDARKVLLFLCRANTSLGFDELKTRITFTTWRLRIALSLLIEGCYIEEVTQ